MKMRGWVTYLLLTKHVDWFKTEDVMIRVGQTTSQIPTVATVDCKWMLGIPCWHIFICFGRWNGSSINVSQNCGLAVAFIA